MSWFLVSHPPRAALQCPHALLWSTVVGLATSMAVAPIDIRLNRSIVTTGQITIYEEAGIKSRQAGCILGSSAVAILCTPYDTLEPVHQHKKVDGLVRQGSLYVLSDTTYRLQVLLVQATQGLYARLDQLKSIKEKIDRLLCVTYTDEGIEDEPNQEATKEYANELFQVRWLSMLDTVAAANRHAQALHNSRNAVAVSTDWLAAFLGDVDTDQMDGNMAAMKHAGQFELSGLKLDGQAPAAPSEQEPPAKRAHRSM